jgi:hypothetical protein
MNHGHNNKITYQVVGDIKEQDMKLPFNSDMFKTILQANKDMDGGKLYLSTMGLMKLEFSNDGISSEYFMVRKAETNFNICIKNTKDLRARNILLLTADLRDSINLK